jgi:hypothetical protein
MTKPGNDEVVSLALALEEVVRDEALGQRGLRFLCAEAARMIRRLRGILK